MSFLTFGWAYFETLYKLRKGLTGKKDTNSRFDDGKIGWRGFALRSQDSLDHWQIAEDGTIEGLHQWDIASGKRAFIPIGKALLFRTRTHKKNPEGRALTLDTPIPTPDGWTTMGDIAVGDKVYDEKGRIRYVVAKSDVFQNRPVYEITFSNGEQIIADENHEWIVATGNDRFSEQPTRRMTTGEMFGRIANGVPTSPHYSVGESPVLDSCQAELPVDPYVLGYWLGDGCSSTSAFSCAPDDRENLRTQLQDAGFTVREKEGYTLGTKGRLMSYLRLAGAQR